MNELPDPADHRARGRFLVISILRLSGVAMVMAGLLILNGVLALPEIAGWIALAIGLVDIFVAPQLLARAWRTPPP